MVIGMIMMITFLDTHLGYRYDIDQTGDNRIYDMIVDYPEEVALLLEDLGYTADELHEMLGIQDHGYINEYLERVS